MAKKSAVAKSPAPNLFANAKKAAAAAPKKEKGTVVQLPKELDTEGKLVGESKLLNDAVTAAIEAQVEEKTAKTKGNLAKTRLIPFAQSKVVELYAKLGVPPPTPFSLVNHNGESVTYVMADKSQQYPLNEEQVELFKSILGEDGAAKVIRDKTVFSFDPDTMEQQAENAKDKTVLEIVAELVSAALANDTRLSDDQKSTLLKSSVKTFLQPNTLDRVAELCGADVAKIGQFYDAAGSSCTRSIKV